MESDDDDLDLDIMRATEREINRKDDQAPHRPLNHLDSANTTDDDYDDDLDLDNIGPTRPPSLPANPTDNPIPAHLDLLTSGNSGSNKSSGGGGSSDDGQEPSPKKRDVVRTVKHEDGSGERIVMTDDEDDDVMMQWRKRRTRGGNGNDKKRQATKRRRKPSSQGEIGADGLVKRRKTAQAKKIVGIRKKRQPPPVFREFPPSDSETVDLQNPLPQYLEEKQIRLKEAKEALDRGEAPQNTFRVPPSYEEIYFSDDERLADIPSKPQLANFAPCAPYKDVVMESSLGVIPCSIAQYLRPYQVEGVQFLHKCFVFQEGCILGDDMGLGKTIQVIAFLTAAFGKTGDERDRKRLRKIRQWGGQDVWYPKVLIICPGTLMSNWQSELKEWGWWRVQLFHGSKENKEDAMAAAKKGSLEIMITTYKTYTLNKDEINLIEWDCVIADECHQFKEKKSGTTQAMNEVNSLCRIGLTGTAIQNKYEELWTLLNWCRPGAVGTLSDWEKKVAKPLKLGQLHGATLNQIGRARSIATMLVNNLLPRMFLRRMKSLIADQLPKKSDRVVFCPLTETQKEVYEAYLDSEEVKTIRDRGDPCDCGSGNKRGGCCYRLYQEKTPNELMFPSIMWIQKLSNHLANWIPMNEDSDGDRARKIELLEMCLPNYYRSLVKRESMLNYKDPEMCGKWVVLQKLLKFWHEQGDKVLIFSYSLQLLYILQALFSQTHYNYCYLDGKTALEDRTEAVDTFNSDPTKFAFLISTKAGGVGLNITAANKVVIFDPNWNPSHDLQAQDRAYRIGQKRDVEVFRLVSAGTIEEIVYARQIYKQQQANIGYNASEERRYFSGVQDDKDNKGELFGLKNLFSFRDGTILRQIVNKANVAESKAGVQLAEVEAVDDDEPVDSVFEDKDDSNGASQLVELLNEGEKKKKDKRVNNPVSAILSAAGISYSHENSEVIGSSKVEAQISRRAKEAMDDTDMGQQIAFDVGSENVLFQPSEEIRKRQFKTMAKMFEFDDIQEFALVVEDWTQEERRRALEKFYRMLKGEAVLHYVKEEDEDEEEQNTPPIEAAVGDTSSKDESVKQEPEDGPLITEDLNVVVDVEDDDDEL